MLPTFIILKWRSWTNGIERASFGKRRSPDSARRVGTYTINLKIPSKKITIQTG